MLKLEERNRIIIDAVVTKIRRDCPGSVSLLAVGGSFANGDFYEKSDLDLLILTKDNAAQTLATVFIQDDLGVGHDLYTTPWERLENDAKFTHPHLAKLLDSVVVWAASPEETGRLENLRADVRKKLAAPLSREEFDNAKNLLSKAESAYARAMCAGTTDDVRANAAEVMSCLPEALMLLNKRYYRRGVRYRPEELSDLPERPENLAGLLDNLLTARTTADLQTALTSLLRETEAVFDRVGRTFAPGREPATPDSLRGTYEEMFSNWRNKMHLAAKTGNRMLAFDGMVSLDAMLRDIRETVDIAEYASLPGYDPEDLWKSAEFFDQTIERYLTEYRKIGMEVNRYASVDDFAEDYRK